MNHTAPILAQASTSSSESTSSSLIATGQSSASPQTQQTTTNSAINNPESQTNTMVTNVAEIFHCAGFAFKKLGELVQQLDANTDQTQDNKYQSHWQPADIEQFGSIVKNFSEELTSLSNSLKNRMSAQLKDEHMNSVVKTLPASDKSLLAKNEQNLTIKTEPTA